MDSEVEYWVVYNNGMEGGAIIKKDNYVNFCVDYKLDPWCLDVRLFQEGVFFNDLDIADVTDVHEFNLEIDNSRDNFS